MQQNAPRIEDGDELFDIPTFMSRNYVSRTLTFREIAAGRLRAWKAGGRNVIPRSEETRWRNALRRVEPVRNHPRRKYPIGPH